MAITHSTIHIDAIINIAHQLLQLREYGLALDYFQYVISLNANCPQAHFGRGAVLHLLNRDTEPLVTFGRPLAAK